MTVMESLKHMHTQLPIVHTILISPVLQKEEDILLRGEIESIGKAHPDRFHYHFSITRKPIPKSEKS